MGHNISAIILRGEFSRERAAQFELTPVPTKYNLTIFPLTEEYCDEWAVRLSIPGFVSEYPLLNARVIHQIANEIAPNSAFAIIETDYFGGLGAQSAAVYQNKKELMAPENAPFGPINKALRLLGVRPWFGDAFNAIGLDKYRNWDDWFAKDQ